jgi:phage gpG-like protein
MAGGVVKTTTDDRLWRRLRDRIKGIGTAYVKVGIVGSGAQADHNGLTNAELMAIHEYGAPKANIPARKPIRRTFADKRDELRGIQRKLAKALLRGTMDVDHALGVLGAWGAGAIKKTIADGLEPPLKEATIKRKGSSTPLVDTGQLINSITWAKGR